MMDRIIGFSRTDSSDVENVKSWKSHNPVYPCSNKISRWDLSELMSATGISPFAEQSAEELAAEVESALKVSITCT